MSDYPCCFGNLQLEETIQAATSPDIFFGGHVHQTPRRVIFLSGATFHYKVSASCYNYFALAILKASSGADNNLLRAVCMMVAQREENAIAARCPT
jgi:hypothetical protein